MFIGSCTNSRLSDLRAAATIFNGRKVADGVRVLVVPGSQAIKKAAEVEGLDQVFRDAGAEWREAGCSMCIAMNGDQLKPGQYAVSTSNRNFEGRQGAGGRTFLASPLTAAAAAVTGRITDARESSPDGRRSRHSPRAPSTCPARSRTSTPTRSSRRASSRRPARSASGESCSPTGASTATGKPKADFVLNTPEATGRHGPGGGRQLRLRLVARARPLGAGTTTASGRSSARRSPTSFETIR